MKLIRRAIQAVRRYRQIKRQERFWLAEIERCRDMFIIHTHLQQWEKSMEWCLKLQMARSRMNREVRVPLGRPLLKVRQKTEFR